MKKIPKPVSHVLTMLIVLVGWVFFRADTLGDAVIYLTAMLGGTADFREAEYLVRQYFPELVLCFIGIFPVKKYFKSFFEKRADKAGWVAAGESLEKVFAAAVFVLAYAKLVSGSFNPFIYFRF